jgi:hypothetical protein
MADDTIELRNYRIVPRKARIDIDGAAAALVLPSFFGRRPFIVPMDVTAVLDLTSEMPGDGLDEEIVFETEPSIPYFFTTGPFTEPTTLLLFREPQRVPPLRWITASAPNVDLPFGARASRSARGAFVDGALLRFRDPADAARRLVRAGATPVDRPEAWLDQDAVSDPIRRETVLRHQNQAMWLHRVAFGLLVVSLLTARGLVDNDDWTALALPAAGLGLGFALQRYADRPPPSSPAGPSPDEPGPVSG